MKIKDLQTIYVDAGWRPWTFVKITTDSGIVGYSECTESFGSPSSLKTAVEDLKPLVLGRDPVAIESLYWDMYMRTRQSAGGLMHKAIAGVTNALYDIKAKSLNIPIYDLLGGAIRTQLPCYWSHFGTTRVRSASHIYKPALKSLKDVESFAREAKDSGFKAVKTNLLMFDKEGLVYAPGFNRSAGGPELNPNKKVIEQVRVYLSVLRKELGPEIDIMVDANFNFKPEGYVKLARAIENLDIHWLELDLYNPQALLNIKKAISMPICSLENLYTSRQYKPYLDVRCVDVASVDVMWNGLLESKRIADLADINDINISAHNHYSHLATYMSAQFCAAIPNFRILELDVDDVPWREELVTESPSIKDGMVILTGKPGWGADLNEKVAAKHPWPK
ncbi:MAG: mandelate racemase/muconate lactonizing enzyme family protein [Candidatus Omnitrophica bacterium]|nr:mandelate racemase/muconate lactonizing enzyme family protein [Candidatus Omnitrophota bacterium]